MIKEKAMKEGRRGAEKTRLKTALFLSILFFCGTVIGQGSEWGPFPWGMTLEELNRDFKSKKKTGQIKEDAERVEIELQYGPDKAIKIRRGNLQALTESSDPSRPGRLYGYAYEGKFFGQAVLFKDHPELFPETVIGLLKERYPQGRILRSFSRNRLISYFEFTSERLSLFTTDRGIYFYDPEVLTKVVKKYQAENEEEIRRYEKERTPERY
jgi:hypothetical protein